MAAFVTIERPTWISPWISLGVPCCALPWANVLIWRKSLARRRPFRRVVGRARPIAQHRRGAALRHGIKLVLAVLDAPVTAVPQFVLFDPYQEERGGMAI